MTICRALLQFLCVALLVLLTPVPGVVAAPDSDGALAKVGPELRALYEAHRAARESGRPLVLSDPTIRVVEDRVVIDAVAAGSVEDLKVHLLVLGLRQVATAGRIVSGQLPIDQIPAMAALPSLRFARAARSTTHDRAGQGVR
jgi:hypothetical protein